MNRTKAGQDAIDKSFAAISGVKSFTSFSRLSSEQRDCVQMTCEQADAIFACKARDLHLKALVVCITGYDDHDEEEPITEGHFSQHRFYTTFVNDLIYFPDRFDFLIHCVMNQVCVVNRPAKYKDLLATLLRKEADRTVPLEVLNYDQLLIDDDERRIESFTMRKDWVCQVPPLEEVTAHAVQQRVATSLVPAEPSL